LGERRATSGRIPVRAGVLLALDFRLELPSLGPTVERAGPLPAVGPPDDLPAVFAVRGRCFENPGDLCRCPLHDSPPAFRAPVACLGLRVSVRAELWTPPARRL